MMIMEQRDKFLTEAMGECWHEWEAGKFRCNKCDVFMGFRYDLEPRNNFSTWEGFGKLWEWAQEQEWGRSFKRFIFDNRSDMASYQVIPGRYINPDRFADAVYKFLIDK